MSVSLAVRMYVCIYVCLSICLSVCLSVSLSGFSECFIYVLADAMYVSVYDTLFVATVIDVLSCGHSRT